MPPLNSPWPPFFRRYFRPARRAKIDPSLRPSSQAQHPFSQTLPSPAMAIAPPSNPPLPPPTPTPTPHASASASASTSASPISRLPVELLTQIFIHVPRTEFYDAFCSSPSVVASLILQPTAPQRRPTCMAIAQVCRRWRAIAIDCKAFWSFIALASTATATFAFPPRWVELSLARTDPCPVSLLVECSSASTSASASARTESYRRAALTTLRTALSRAREIHLQSALATDSEFRAEALHLLDASAAPLLEAFSVRGNTARDVAALSDDIFLGCVPLALRSLTLVYCDVHHSSPLFRAPLTSLHLANCFLEFPLQVLTLLPHLRTLVLDNTHGAQRMMKGSSSEEAKEALRLPHLQRIELTNVSADIAFLLQAIQIPPSSSLSITCTDCLDIDEPLDDLALLHSITSNMSPVLSTHLERALSEDHMFPHLEIASPASTSRKTLVLLDPATADPASETRQLLFSLVWASTSPTYDKDKDNRLSSSSSSTIDLFTQMLSALPPTALQCIHTLHMRDASYSSSPISLCAADARSRPSPFAVYHDRARDEAVRGLLAIVMRQELLPALRQVSLEDIDFKYLDVDLLARALVHRQRTVAVSGGKISLSLQNCIMNVGTIRGLRDCLGPDAVDVDYASK